MNIKISPGQAGKKWRTKKPMAFFNQSPIQSKINQLQSRQIVLMKAGQTVEAQEVAVEVVKLKAQLGTERLQEKQNEIAKCKELAKSAMVNKLKAIENGKKAIELLAELERELVALQTEIATTRNAIANYSNLSDSWGETARRNSEYADRLESEMDNCAIEYIS